MFHHTIHYRDGSPAYQIELEHYFIDYIPGIRETLFITFENAMTAIDRSDGVRHPWSYRFLKPLGFPMIGVKAKQADWFRRSDLHRFWRSQAFGDFLATFPRIILYGSSMGGYAALAFAETIPHCEVIAHNPQTTLSPALAPWETRYASVRAEDWEGDFADGAVGARNAAKVVVSYDPFFKPDRRHIERLDPANLFPIKVPLVGHSLPDWLLQMDVLKEIVLATEDGTLTQARCRELARARRNIPRYYLGMAQRARHLPVMQACIDRAWQLRPDDPETLRNTVQVLRQRRQWEWLAEWLRHRLEEEPDKAALHHYLSDALAHVGHAEVALPHAMKATQMEPDNTSYLVQLGEVRMRLGQWEEAEQTVREALRLDVSLAVAYRLLSRILWTRGDRGLALIAAHEAVERDPHNVTGLFYYAEYLHHFGSTQAAITALQIAQSFNPDYLPIYTLLADCYHKAMRRQDGIALLEDMLRRHPDYRPAMGLLDRMREEKVA